MPIQLGEGETRRLDVTLTPIPLQPATLDGYVVEEGTNEAIVGASVELVGYTSATTNTAGYFKIDNIEPGEYLVRISHPDYQTIEV
jgi:hypothetical protein